ncbi:MAG TPA: DUF4142 domain-containing protein [Candidatus Elarobacter sp.]|jgi:putative membrane protein
MKRSAATLTLAALCAGTALAQSDVPPATPSARAAERAVVAYVVQDSVAEVQIARLAAGKTSNEAVRAFAQRMIQDHSAAAQQGVTLGKQIGAADARMKPSDEGPIELQHLSRYSGKQFDDEYLKGSVKSHEHDIETVRDALEGSSNPDVVQFERTVLAQMEDHLRLAHRSLDALAR